MIKFPLPRITALLLAAASAAPAQAVPDAMAIFCAQLDRTIEAVELGDTTALERSRARPPDFGFRYGCNAQGGGWFCHQSLAPPGLSLGGLAAGVRHCRPDFAQIAPALPDHVLFTGRNVRIRIMESGAPRAHVGRIVTFMLEPRASGQARERPR